MKIRRLLLSLLTIFSFAAAPVGGDRMPEIPVDKMTQSRADEFASEG